MQLGKGIGLTVIPTSQFKTVRVAVDFIAPVTVSELSKRILMAQLLETSSQDYPTQTALATALSNMYGASFGVNVFRYGRINGLRFSGNVVDGVLLGDPDVLATMFNFMKKVIFRPLVKDDAFESQTFTLQQRNLIAYLKSLDDDKQYHADQQLQNMVFSDLPELATSLYGDAATIATLDGQGLLADYQNLLATNQVQVTVVGDVTEAQIKALMGDWPLPDRTPLKESPIVTRLRQPLIEKTEQQAVAQAKLNLAYQLPIGYRTEQFYAALVFNGLFGGTPISLLFKNVREKNSLAYFASSQFDAFTGMLSVRTGIESHNRQAVEAIIAAQLTAIQNGQFSDELFDQVVASLINGRESRMDSAQALLNQAVLDELVGSHVSTAEWVQQVNAVSKQTVSAVAQQVTQQATYFLEGADDNETAPLS